FGITGVYAGTHPSTLRIVICEPNPLQSDSADKFGTCNSSRWHRSECIGRVDVSHTNSLSTRSEINEKKNVDEEDDGRFGADRGDIYVNGHDYAWYCWSCTESYCASGC